MFDRKQSQFYQFDNNGYILDEDDKVFIKNYKNFVVTNWSIEGIELPKRDLENIRIYHTRSDIERAWRNFYKILKQYFNFIKDFNNWSNGRVDFGIIMDTKYKTYTIATLIKEWTNSIESKLTKEDLINFFKDINITSSKLISFSRTFMDKLTYGYNILDVLIKLYSEQLYFNLTENFNQVKFMFFKDN